MSYISVYYSGALTDRYILYRRYRTSFGGCRCRDQRYYRGYSFHKIYRSTHHRFHTDYKDDRVSLLRNFHRQQLTDSQTNKSKHKKSRKRAAGRKGTVDEYDYLIASIGRLVIRVDEKSGKQFTFSVVIRTLTTQRKP